MLDLLRLVDDEVWVDAACTLDGVFLERDDDPLVEGLGVDLDPAGTGLIAAVRLVRYGAKVLEPRRAPASSGDSSAFQVAGAKGLCDFCLERGFDLIRQWGDFPAVRSDTVPVRGDLLECEVPHLGCTPGDSPRRCLEDAQDLLLVLAQHLSMRRGQHPFGCFDPKVAIWGGCENYADSTQRRQQLDDVQRISSSKSPTMPSPPRVGLGESW